MKKGVFIYSNFDFSVKNAGVTRMKYYAQAIANTDTCLYLVSCSSSAINEQAFKEIYPNVFILDNNTLTSSFSGTYNFIKNLYQFSKKATQQQTYLFYPSPLVYLEVIAMYYLKFLKKCTVFYELNEIRKYTSTFHEPMSLARPMYSVKKLIYKTTFSAMEGLLRFYDGLICISTAIETYGKRFNSTTIRIPILTNPNLEKEFTNETYSNAESFNIGFSGSIHPIKENLNNFFQVLGRLHKSGYEFTFNLCGPIKKVHQTELFDKLAETLNIKTITNYYGNLDAKNLSTFLSQQQLLVIPRGYTPQNNYGFSTKLSDYLDHAKPVLVTDVSDNKLFIKDGINGFIVPTDDNDKMYEKLAFIIENYDEMHEDIQQRATETSRQHFYFRNFHDSFHTFFFNFKSLQENKKNSRCNHQN